MNFQTGKENLKSCHKVLSSKWSLLNQIWKDDNAQYFKKHCIQSLEREMKSAINAIEDLDQLFKQVKEDCIDE